MQLSVAVILGLVLAGVAHCRPTFDKIAEVMLNAIDDPHPHYHQPGRPVAYPHPHSGPGPLIHEGYEHGYDYHYGGGYGYQGYQQEPHPGYSGYYPQRPPVHPPTSYYPPPQSSRPGYYAHQPAVPTPAPGGYYHTQDHYGGGYKQRGY